MASTPDDTRPTDLTILLTSVGRRVELIRLFDDAIARHQLPVRILGTEIDPLSPAAQALGRDRVVLVPRVRDPRFPDAIRDLVREHSVDLVLPLIDPDIEVLAGEGGRLEGTDATFGSVPRQFMDVVSDKWRTFQWMTEQGVPTPQSWLPDDHEWAGEPVIIKPRNGSGSANVFRVTTEREFGFFREYVPQAIVQEMLPGPEVTIDVIIGRDGQVLGTAQRERIAVRGGEVSKGVTIDSDEIEELAHRVTAALTPSGPITVQGMWGGPVVNGQRTGFKVTEVNARMGGGLPLAVAAGLDVPALLFGSWLGRDVGTGHRARPGVTMTRFDESFFIQPDQA